MGTLAVMLAACSGEQFRVEGQIADAADSMLYFEHVGLDGIEALDSVKLGKDGDFSFKGQGVDAPEFYRLRISGQIINVAVDSTETIGIKAHWPLMATNYEVTGSEDNLMIKELAVKQMDLQSRAVALERSGMLTPQEVRDSVTRMLFAYKEDVKSNYIFKMPYKSYAYFALFQTIGPWLIFDPKSNADDVKVFAAVATSWDTFHPNALRGKNLHNIAIEGLKNVRILEARNRPQTVEAGKVEQAGVLEVELADNKGNIQKLTAQKGKVVLLDFHVFAMKDSPKRILMLRELYNKYHGQGFEIFQVSLDDNAHYWKQMTAALPWICVRDDDGLNSTLLMRYNISQVPEFFLVDRDNNLVKRSGQMKDLESEIRKLL